MHMSHIDDAHRRRAAAASYGKLSRATAARRTAERNARLPDVDTAMELGLAFDPIDSNADHQYGPGGRLERKPMTHTQLMQSTERTLEYMERAQAQVARAIRTGHRVVDSTVRFRADFEADNAAREAEEAQRREERRAELNTLRREGRLNELDYELPRPQYLQLQHQQQQQQASPSRSLPPIVNPSSRRAQPLNSSNARNDSDDAEGHNDTRSAGIVHPRLRRNAQSRVEARLRLEELSNPVFPQSSSSPDLRRASPAPPPRRRGLRYARPPPPSGTEQQQQQQQQPSEEEIIAQVQVASFSQEQQRASAQQQQRPLTKLPKHVVKVPDDVGDCSCCLESMTNPLQNEVSVTVCGHFFHTKCLGRWLLEKDSCPLCRETF